VVDLADQITSTSLGGDLFESYVHDDDGNMTTRTLASTSAVTGYIWNDFKHLIGFLLNGTSEESDFYDTDGLRRIRSDGTKYYNAGSAQLAEKRPTSGQVSFIQGHQVLGLQEGGQCLLLPHGRAELGAPSGGQAPEPCRRLMGRTNTVCPTGH